jgi:hypothetical protein
MAHGATLILKARQLGATWVVAAVSLWYLLYRPGSYCILFSYTEAEAKEIIARIWTMYMSSPLALRAHVQVVTPGTLRRAIGVAARSPPRRSARRIRALPATKKHGRGANATLVVMDEAVKTPSRSTARSTRRSHAGASS